MIDFETAFGEFLDRREYDAGEGALFFIVRSAFLSGWQAAGGIPPAPRQVLRPLSQSKLPEEKENGGKRRPMRGLYLRKER